MPKINPVALVPHQYRSVVKGLYGSEFNTVVLRVADPASGKKKPVRFAFTFKGDELQRAKELIRRFGSSKIPHAVQEMAWKMFPRDSRGNFLVYPDPDRISIKGDNCLSYKSAGVKTTNDNSIFFLSTNCESNESPGSVFYRSSFSSALKSPDTLFKDSSNCISNDGSSNRFEACKGSYTNGSKDIVQKGSTNTMFENSLKIVVEGCKDLKAYGCSLLEIIATNGKELKGLVKRQIESGNLKLFWYEKIPVLGKLLIPRV